MIVVGRHHRGSSGRLSLSLLSPMLVVVIVEGREKKKTNIACKIQLSNLRLNFTDILYLLLSVSGSASTSKNAKRQ